MALESLQVDERDQVWIQHYRLKWTDRISEEAPS